MDRPLQPSALALRELTDYFYEVTDADLQQDRDEVLGCTPETIRGFAGHIRAILAEGAVCVLGNASQIDKNAEMFRSTRELY